MNYQEVDSCQPEPNSYYRYIIVGIPFLVMVITLIMVLSIGSRKKA